MDHDEIFVHFKRFRVVLLENSSIESFVVDVVGRLICSLEILDPLRQPALIYQVKKVRIVLRLFQSMVLQQFELSPLISLHRY